MGATRTIVGYKRRAHLDILHAETSEGHRFPLIQSLGAVSLSRLTSYVTEPGYAKKRQIATTLYTPTRCNFCPHAACSPACVLPYYYPATPGS